MAFSKKNAVDAARSIFNDHRMREKARLDRIAYALNPRALNVSNLRPSEQNGQINVPSAWWDPPPAVELPSNATDQMQNLARKARTNYLPRVLNDFVQSLKVDGYRAEGRTDNAPPWTNWQANQLDGRQGGIYRVVLAYGIGYGVVLPGNSAPSMRFVSPRKMTALYGDPVEDEWPILALRHDNELMRLYDEEQVYYIGRRRVVPGSGQVMARDIQFIEAKKHDLGVCPVVRYRDEMLLDEADQTGIIEPLITLQRRVDETVFGMLIAQFYAAFKQRVVIGWVPKSEEEELKASASSLWTFEDAPGDVNVDSLDETDLTRYIASKESGITDMATISQVPHQNLGIGAIANLSAEALAAMEHSKTNRADQFRTSIGESHEQFLRLSAQAAGDDASANDVHGQVRWADKTARSFGAMVDGLTKIVSGLDVPARATWPLIPGLTDQDVKAWEVESETGRAAIVAQLREVITQHAANGQPVDPAIVALVDQLDAPPPTTS